MRSRVTFYVDFKPGPEDIPENTSLRHRMIMSKPSYRKSESFETLEEAQQFANQLGESKEPSIKSLETIRIWRDHK